MIDDYAATMALIEQMKAQLPIPIYGSKNFIRSMLRKGVMVTRRQQLQIESVLYGGDDGGIMCALKGIGTADTVIVCSLTHLEIQTQHPLAEAIKAYQRERTRKLARERKEGKLI